MLWNDQFFNIIIDELKFYINIPVLMSNCPKFWYEKLQPVILDLNKHIVHFCFKTYFESHFHIIVINHLFKKVPLLWA
jgi:hypothetical protein